MYVPVQFSLEYNELLNEALLSFDISLVIDQLRNISTTLRNDGQTALADDIDLIIMDLTDIRDNQIPIIQNQTVSVYVGECVWIVLTLLQSFQSTLSSVVGQLDTVINTTVMNVTRVLNTTNELIANITGETLNGFLDEVSNSRVSSCINVHIVHAFHHA